MPDVPLKDLLLEGRFNASPVIFDEEDQLPGGQVIPGPDGRQPLSVPDGIVQKIVYPKNN